MEKCRENQPGQQKCIKQPEEQKDFLIQAATERKKTTYRLESENLSKWGIMVEVCCLSKPN